MLKVLSCRLGTRHELRKDDATTNASAKCTETTAIGSSATSKQSTVTTHRERRYSSRVFGRTFTLYLKRFLYPDIRFWSVKISVGTPGRSSAKRITWGVYWYIKKSRRQT